MKKFLLFIGLSLVAFIGNTQVIFYVESPSANEGNYDFTWADPGGGWGCPDLTNPANQITDTMVFASDGTAGDSLGCNAITNGAEIDGQIAVIYRGSCEFGTKALNCQNAGAVGVIIINNVAGAPVGMAPGSDGASVTIPLVMVSDATGALLKAEIEAQNSTAFIGSKSGYYNNDLGFYPEHILRAKNFGNVQELSKDDTEFDVELGAWVFNYGSNDITNVTLNAQVEYSSSVIYDETSAAVANLASGDSTFISLPTFSDAAGYSNGYYDITYTIDSDSTDEFMDDNMREADFMMTDSLFSLSQLDATNGSPIATAYYRAGGDPPSSMNTHCLAFRNANASRVAVKGMTFSASTVDPDPLDGQFVEVFAYEWNDNFTDLNDPNAGVNAINELTKGEYLYTAELQNDSIFIPFEEQVLLSDDQRYLFCAKNIGTTLYFGWDNETDYTTNVNTHLQPKSPIYTTTSQGTNWFIGGFGSDLVPALSVHMFPAAVGIEEEEAEKEILPYPNPAQNIVNIPMGENLGAVELTVMDMNGRIVNSQNIEMQSQQLTVDVSDLSTGSYIFNIVHGNNESKTITVNVNR